MGLFVGLEGIREIGYGGCVWLRCTRSPGLGLRGRGLRGRGQGADGVRL